MVQVGLSSDIEPIGNMMVKLALVELSKDAETGLASLQDEFAYDYYMWANRRERHYHNWNPFAAPGNLPTILKWYGVKVAKEDACPICSHNIVLDEGDDLMFEGDMSDIVIDLS